MKTVQLTLAAILIASTLSAAEPNVLVIASTRPFSSQQGVKPMDEPSIIRLAKDRLARDMKVTGKINIVFEEVYKTKKIETAVGGDGGLGEKTYKSHSLAQWFFWPEGREERLASLQNKGQTKWDAVVIIGDPSIIMNTPGMYAEGATLIINKVLEGTAKPILIVPPSGDASAVSEAVCRVGMSANTPVLPYPSASTIKTIATKAFDTPNPFAMKYVDKRKITYNHTGSSSERGIEGGIKAATSLCGVSALKTTPKETEGTIDFNYGRGNSGFEKEKQYKVEPENFDRSYGFPMQDHSKSASVTMLYGIDQRDDDGTDLGIATDMISQNEVEKDIRCIPIRLMSAKLHDANPELMPNRDSWHMSKPLDAASGSFIYTLLSGRCPVGDKPSPDNKDAWNQWLGQTIGYETAWRMSHIGSRVPGFVVRPVGSGSLEVKFVYPPKADVTVAIVADQADAADVTPTTLTFTPATFNSTQTVTVKAKADAPEFRVKLITQSTDTDFNQLHDSWPYPVK